MDLKRGIKMKVNESLRQGKHTSKKFFIIEIICVIIIILAKKEEPL